MYGRVIEIIPETPGAHFGPGSLNIESKTQGIYRYTPSETILAVNRHHKANTHDVQVKVSAERFE
jgi:hypothetical protein